MTGATVRDATERDAAACAAIYQHYVVHTAISFEYDPPTAAEMAERIATAQRSHAWLVLVETGDERPGQVVGYAYGHPFAPRTAYRFACEVSVYLDADRLGAGGGRALYAELLPRLAARGYRTAVAGIALPNAASLGLHEKFGFEPVGTYRRIGWKFDTWHDVLWTQVALCAPGPVGSAEPPAEPA